MRQFRLFLFAVLICVHLQGAPGVFSQETEQTTPSISQEISETDGVPVILKHLPDYEDVGNRADFIRNSDDLRKSLGERPVFDLIEFEAGTEAAAAAYPQGKLLIIEYPTPQFSIDADNKIKHRLGELGGNPPIFYRRIGNYNAFVFDAADESAAAVLLDQVKYEKTVRWLNGDPFALKRAERAFVLQTSDLFLSIIFVIVGGLGFSVLAGIIVGLIFYYVRDQKRAGMAAFSDAGGMTRLNLDGFTPEILPDAFLKD